MNYCQRTSASGHVQKWLNDNENYQIDESHNQQRTLCVISGMGVRGNGSKNDCFKSRSETVALLQQLSCSNGVLLMLSSELGANNIYSNLINSCWCLCHWLLLIE